MVRKLDDKSIFYAPNGEKEAKIKINSLELHMNQLELNIDYYARLVERLNVKDKPIYVDFLKRISVEYSLKTEKVFSWNEAYLNYLSRYFFVGMKLKDSAYNWNNSRFHKDTEEFMIQLKLNNTYYPIQPMVNEKANRNFYELYNSYVQCCRGFQDKAPMLSLKDWKSLYPIVCFDTSDIDKTRDVNNVTVTLLIKKSEKFQPKMYCVILEEAKIKMSLRGSQITIIEPFKGTVDKK